MALVAPVALGLLAAPAELVDLALVPSEAVPQPGPRDAVEQLVHLLRRKDRVD